MNHFAIVCTFFVPIRRLNSNCIRLVSIQVHHYKQSLANKGDIYMTFKKLGQNFSLQAYKEDLHLN